MIEQLTLVGAFGGAGVNLFPINFCAGSVDDLPGSGGNFGPDPFAGEQRHFVSHGASKFTGEGPVVEPSGEMAFLIGNMGMQSTPCNDGVILLYLERQISRSDRRGRRTRIP